MFIKAISATRYLILIPIIGLIITAGAMFIFGGLGLIRYLWEGLRNPLESHDTIVEIVEYIHFFLIGTVLYITALGFYQLFIHEVDLPHWLKIEDTDELETNLIGVSVVVLAVDFLGVAIAHGRDDMLNYGAGIALPIAALAIFLWARAYAASRNNSGHK